MLEQLLSFRLKNLKCGKIILGWRIYNC